MVRGSGALLKSGGAGLSATLAEILVCPLSKQPLRLCEKTNSLISDSIGVSYPILDGIPRLVPADGKLVDCDEDPSPGDSGVTNSSPENNSWKILGDFHKDISKLSRTHLQIDLHSQTMPYSTNASSMASDKDEFFLKRRLQFADNLKDLKNLKKQLYSAADCLESSYNQDYHKQFVVESSRDYVGRALVSTVDHLGSVADKLEKFLDEKAHEFSATIFQFSLVEQRLSTLQDFIYMNGLSQHSLKMEESTLSQPKHHIFPEETFVTAKPKVLDRNSVSTIPYDVQSTRQGSPSSKAFQATKMKPDSPVLRKKESRRPSREPSPISPRLSFSRITPSKEAGRRSVSPLGFPFHLSGSSNKTSDSPTPSTRDSPHRFPFNLSGSFNKRSVSPTPSSSKRQWVSEPRRAVSAYRARPDRMMANSREKEIEESYTKRSKHLFKALLSFPHSRK